MGSLSLHWLAQVCNLHICALLRHLHSGSFHDFTHLQDTCSNCKTVRRSSSMATRNRNHLLCSSQEVIGHALNDNQSPPGNRTVHLHWPGPSRGAGEPRIHCTSSCSSSFVVHPWSLGLGKWLGLKRLSLNA